MSDSDFDQIVICSLFALLMKAAHYLVELNEEEELTILKEQFSVVIKNRIEI